MWATIILITASLAGLAAIGVMLKTFSTYRQKARQAGYASLGDYLRATPRSDQEKRDAVDLALKGLVICLLGLVFPPFLLLGLLPFFYGARKLVLSAMGFGLVDEGEPPCL